MRVMVIVLAKPESEAGAMPSTEMLEAMGKYNEELVQAGVMLGGEGLKPSSAGVRVRFKGDEREVIEGPFAGTGELVAGFWIWQVRSLDEAIEWVKRCPNPMEGDSTIEIRQVYDMDDFGPEFTGEAREAAQQREESAPPAETDRRMQVMVIHKNDPASENTPPDEASFTEMGGYMEQLLQAGLLVSAEGLHPSRRGARVHFSGPTRTVVDGPFTEAKELVAGYSVLRVHDLDEAIEWVKRTPMPRNLTSTPELEIRPMVTAEDFGEAFTPELREAEEKLRERLQ